MEEYNHQGKSALKLSIYFRGAEYAFKGQKSVIAPGIFRFRRPTSAQLGVVGCGVDEISVVESTNTASASDN